MPRFVFISDTHNRRTSLPAIPPGDVLVHCGDGTMKGTAEEIILFGRWFRSQPHRYKIFVPGNHDFLFETNRQEAEALLSPNSEIDVLINERFRVEAVEIYGSPDTANLANWAFYSGERPDWSHIPEGLDLLITHAPPRGVLDSVPEDGQVGCPRLRNAVEYKTPRNHVFGHIHECGGQSITTQNTNFYNVAALDRTYTAVRSRQPLVLDL